jgi:hypothetical protein
MNGEQTTDMKDIRTETHDTVPDTFTSLSSPHFDELAVAVAQPVQPIRPRRKKRLLRSSLFLIAYLAFIVTTVGIAYLSPPSSRADVSNETVISETQPDEHAGVVNSSLAGTPENESTAPPVIPRAQSRLKRVAGVRFQNQTIQVVEGGEGKPVPRKIGEIRYGRSPDRP